MPRWGKNHSYRVTKGMNNEKIMQILSAYFREEAELLYLLLSRDGAILEANRYTESLLGDEKEATHISDLIVDFAGSFDLLDMSRNPDREYLLNLQTFSGLPQTFVCRAFELREQIVLLGKLNLGDIESLRQELISSNNELHNLSRELQRKNAELARLNQLKNQFLGMAAHDLRKPVGIILSYAEFLADETGDTLNEEHRGFLEIILSSSEFMRRIIDDFLDVARIESGQFEVELQPEDMRTLLRENLALHQIQARRKEIEIQFDCPETIPAISLDRGKIEQVLNNLLGNAIEHSFPKGRIIVAVIPADDSLKVSVRDEGPGIPHDELDRLFSPFERGSVQKIGGEKSTGLGLTISHKIIEAHHGTIGVNSEVGAGSTFYFSLPIEKGGTKS